MNRCKECGSYAINHHDHGRDGSDPELCDVCYWRKRATDGEALRKDAARYRWLRERGDACQWMNIIRVDLEEFVMQDNALDAAIDAAMQASREAAE